MEPLKERDAVLDLIEHGDMPAFGPANDNREETKGAGSSAPLTSPDKTEPRKRCRPSSKDALIRVAEGCDLWRNHQNVAFASYSVRGHIEHSPIRGSAFRIWLAGKYYEATNSAAGNQAIEDCLRLLEARALFSGERRDTFIRVGRCNDTIWIDLGNDAWEVIEVDRHGWRVVSNAPVMFVRPAAMKALPPPEAGGMLEELRPFCNVSSEAEFHLIAAWLVRAWQTDGAFPALVVNGEAGSGKSSFCRMIRDLVDPAVAPIRSPPKDEEDLIVAAANSWVLAYDNLSSISPSMSDAIARICTGGGFSTRAKYTNDSEFVVEAARPVLLNGIPMLTDRADLAERSLTIHLQAISESVRRTETELLADFDRARPRIMATILDGVSAALRNWDTVRLDKMPRLAGFAKWITAAEPGLGWEPNSFLPGFMANQVDVSEAAFEADMVAVAIFKFITRADWPDGWNGTATELLAFLNNKVSDTVRKARRWPANPSAMGNAFTRAAPGLRKKGFITDRVHSGERTITLIPPAGSTVPRASGPMDDEVPV